MYSLSKFNTGGQPIALSSEGTIYCNEQKNKQDQREDPFLYIKETDIKKLIGRKLKGPEVAQLRYSFIKEQPPITDDLLSIYEHFKDIYDKANSHEIEASNCMLYPSTTRRNRIFVAGATGAGKSTWVSAYVREFLKINPSVSKVFLFSDVDPEADRVLGALNPIRIKLDNKLVERPIEPKELANSVVIFDDTDSISDKKIRMATEVLASSILKQGSSKHSIELIITRHASSDFRSTRDIQINLSHFVFFPASKLGLSYTLSKFGLDKQQVQKLMSLPTRWAVLSPHCPSYVVHQNGAFLL